MSHASQRHLRHKACIAAFAAVATLLGLLFVLTGCITINAQPPVTPAPTIDAVTAPAIPAPQVPSVVAADRAGCFEFSRALSPYLKTAQRDDSSFDEYIKAVSLLAQEAGAAAPLATDPKVQTSISGVSTSAAKMADAMSARGSSSTAEWVEFTSAVTAATRICGLTTPKFAPSE
jgi:hypothetical protein